MTGGRARIGRSWDDIQPYYISGQGADVAGTATYGTTPFQWYKFTDNHAKDEQLQFSFQLPHRWAAATDVHLHLHVVPSANGAGGNEDVSFRLSYQWIEINSAFSTTTMTTPADTTFRVGVADANKHLIWEFTALAGAGHSLSSDLAVIIYRMSKTNAADNYTGDIWLRYIDLHVEIDSLGSISELAK